MGESSNQTRDRLVLASAGPPLYRRYPDPASLALALLDEHERQLQSELISGAPPLGPGATPAERLADRVLGD